MFILHKFLVHFLPINIYGAGIAAVQNLHGRYFKSLPGPVTVSHTPHQAKVPCESSTGSWETPWAPGVSHQMHINVFNNSRCPGRQRVLNDPLPLHTAPAQVHLLGEHRWQKINFHFLHFRLADFLLLFSLERPFFFWVFFCFSFCRAYITVSWNTNGHQHKHHLQGSSMKLRQIVLKLAWLISENCQWLADYGLNWSQIATKSHEKSSTDIFQ